jgi:Uncharacterized vancomycin resistance protein
MYDITSIVIGTVIKYKSLLIEEGVIQIMKKKINIKAISAGVLAAAAIYGSISLSTMVIKAEPLDNVGEISESQSPETDTYTEPTTTAIEETTAAVSITAETVPIAEPTVAATTEARTEATTEARTEAATTQASTTAAATAAAKSTQESISAISETTEVPVIIDNFDSFGSGSQADVIINGIFLGTLDLGQKSKSEAIEEIEEYITGLINRELVIEIAGQQERRSLSSLGYTWENPEIALEIAKVGKGGNLIKRFTAVKSAQKDGVIFEPIFSYDTELVDEFIKEFAKKYNTEPKNATLSRENGRFIIGKEVVGFVVNLEELSTAILETGNDYNSVSEVKLAAEIKEEAPRYTEATLVEIKDEIGTYTTSYTGGNALGRNINIRVGTEKINGIVLLPGDEVSANELLSPFTLAGGYLPAGAYENGTLVQSIGGGVCQITTTLYNALIKAEVDITERHPHSMIVGYVPRSMDAAIAGTVKDLKFKNNHDTPIYISGIYGGGKLTFSVYGKEVRPSNRTIKYESKVISESWPTEPAYTEVDTLAPGVEDVIQNAYPAVRSELWKYIYVGGVQTEQILVHRDSYRSAPKLINIGAGEPVSADEPTDTDITSNVNVPNEEAVPTPPVDLEVSNPPISDAPINEVSSQ